MNWIDINDKKPNVESADGFGEYYESELVLVAFEDNRKIFYEVAKFTKGRDSKDNDFWESWYVPQAEDVVVNVVAWMPFPFFS